jgi:superfamily II DNA or RNA helicase
MEYDEINQIIQHYNKNNCIGEETIKSADYIGIVCNNKIKTLKDIHGENDLLYDLDELLNRYDNYYNNNTESRIYYISERRHNVFTALCRENKKHLHMKDGNIIILLSMEIS